MSTTAPPAVPVRQRVNVDEQDVDGQKENGEEEDINRFPEIDFESDEILTVGHVVNNAKLSYINSGDLSLEEIQLKDLRGKYLLLFAYPRNFMYISPNEVIYLNEVLGKFLELECNVIAFAMENPYTHSKWMETESILGGIGPTKLTICSDSTAKLAKKFGCYDDEAQQILRASILIDPDGVIIHKSVGDPSVPRSIEEILRILRAFRFAKENGVQCPANWKEGEEGISTVVEESKQYFAKLYKVDNAENEGVEEGEGEKAANEEDGE